MRKVIEANQRDGYETVEDNSKGEFGGISFARRDFFRVGPISDSLCEGMRSASYFLFFQAPTETQ
jgi:hypothetical protein